MFSRQQQNFDKIMNEFVRFDTSLQVKGSQSPIPCLNKMCKKGNSKFNVLN